MTMKKNEAEIKEMLEDIYKWNHKVAMKIYQAIDDYEEDDDPEEEKYMDLLYKTGEVSGTANAIGAVYLALFGGEERFRLWMDTIEGNEKEENLA